MRASRWEVRVPPSGVPADQVLDVEDLFGRAARTTANSIITEPDVPTALQLAATFLRAAAPTPSATTHSMHRNIDEATALVDTITTDPSLLRVSQLAAHAGLSTRQLQRLFAEYVGIGPKWVIRRTRIQEAASRAATTPQDWSALATELGYADQAHFTRDFTGAVGVSPAQYASWARRG
ncbi:AraC family transcriptional regulator [Streptomyces sp. SID12501]|uniref:Helix-turn-helix transcriptional regulator n=1 Tax=Streptomyces sp. SID12501 TaxID=2706042 RepID=A0A6B3BM28_9ACTN|nr:AraC family transcriptional regulator [Streptomyces sp. SID12501]NEC84766.1 helix-turn-helix transcriptional regulator [Streptomyces sp. SID12501]